MSRSRSCDICPVTTDEDYPQRWTQYRKSFDLVIDICPDCAQLVEAVFVELRKHRRPVDTTAQLAGSLVRRVPA